MNKQKKKNKKYKVVLPDKLHSMVIDGQDHTDSVHNTLDRMLALPGNIKKTIYINNLEELTSFIIKHSSLHSLLNDVQDPKIIGPIIKSNNIIVYKTTGTISDFKLNESLMPAYTIEYELYIDQIYVLLTDFNDIPKK